MIAFSKFELSNGLRVIVHEDESTPMAAVNILYNVGARDESPEKTGFAHLFEHLMFEGSVNIPDFDDPLQLAGGDSNAFTNNDITNFYNIVPAQNLETVFWLESDRMLNLDFNEQSLQLQQKVVIEEFKETCLDKPYGDVWHHLADMAYQVHPYRWPTIGKVPQHIADATLHDVKDFFYKHYRPNNAILVVAGNVQLEEVKRLTEKWFGNIPRGQHVKASIPQEPPQQHLQHRINNAKVPVDALYLAFHIPGRLEQGYYVADMLSDVLSNGQSSRLYRRLLKERAIFDEIDAYITGSIDPGLLIIEGNPADGVSLETAEAAIWEELERLKNEPISQRELQKQKNKLESTLVFSEANILNKAINLAFYEVLGDAQLINEEAAAYECITVDDLQQMAQQTFVRENCSDLYYRATATA